MPVEGVVGASFQFVSSRFFSWKILGFLAEKSLFPEMSKTNRFVFTANNYTDDDLKWFQNTDVFKYVCFGQEVGQSLTPHLQGYFEFDNSQKLRLSAVIKRLAENGLNCRPHIEPARGTAAQAIAYCEKDGVFFEKGDRPKGQGKRTDLDTVCEILTNGGSIQDVAMSHPSVYVKFHRGLTSLQVVLSPRRTWKTEIYWLWGPTGSGKSRWAWETYPDAYSKVANTKWWCGYTDQDTAIIDDFRPSKEMPFNFVLNLFDRYPLLLESKGGQVQCLFKTIIVTCPYSPDQVLGQLEWVGIEQGAQLKRRIDHVIQFPQLAMMYLEERSG